MLGYVGSDMTVADDVEIHAMAEFAGVGAISPERFRKACLRIAEAVGRPLDDALRAEISDALGKMQCPLD